MEFNITLLIVIITALTSYQCFNNRTLFDKLKHNPYLEYRDKEYYRIISSGFVHADMTHLVINMYVLYIFGSTVETIFTNMFGDLKGKLFFLLLYFGSMIIADAGTFAKHKDNPSYSSIGASGAVSGILFSYILFAPWAMLLLFFIIPIPAIIFAVLYLIYSSWAEKNQPGNIDHSAHFMGALGGLFITLVLYPGIVQIFFDNLVDIPFIG